MTEIEDYGRVIRTRIQVGSTEFDGFMLPDGSYRMSLTQAAECVGKPARSTFDFLRSKALKRLLQEVGGTFDFLPEETIAAISDGTYSADQFRVDIGEAGSQGETRIRAVPLGIVNLYWHWEAFRENKQAFFLVVGLSKESLERRFDAAFGISQTEQERNERLVRSTQELGRITAESELAEVFAMHDIALQENRRLWQILRENNIDPYALPSNENEDEE